MQDQILRGAKWVMSPNSDSVKNCRRYLSVASQSYPKVSQHGKMKISSAELLVCNMLPCLVCAADKHA